MKKLSVLILGIVFISCSSNNGAPSFPKADQLIQQLQETASISDETTRKTRIDAIWDSLTVNKLIPLTEDSIALFLYRGEAGSVSWNGDFNSWSGDKRVDTQGSNIMGTDIWFLKMNFPSDARLDYKITIENENWILDPANPHQQWSGFGPNSELRMPDWKEEPLTKTMEEAGKGSLSAYKLIESDNLGYEVRYRVYTPAGYENFENLPVLYVTDGQEYSDEQLGATTIVLDNLIHLQKIEPVIAVFVEPLNPDNPDENRRMDEFGNNEEYLAFYIEELIPEIERSYKVIADKDNRGILGTSLGGLNATYFAFTEPDVFGAAAIQAPAYWFREEIYDLVRNYEGEQPKLYMSTGTIGDNTEESRLMKSIFEEKNYSFEYLEVNEGHSWGAWSAQMDDILVYFYGN
ncbi:MAG: prolyl oligopeptidase family serine peptidase [Balneolaceae bacterium]|nr:prolyl oligopeptidase family serine peptidase [Balneolaceae bacterium]MBO6546673.1 prolyl oligopeptidase family serine peptidase [Balneolaceae bacterium]MBO6649031.1 prolyl oligopeptidase family serine peptidase [Balneolaceae bacterium]